MVKYAGTIYDNAADLQTAIALIDNTVTIIVISFMEAGRQKFMLIT